jgi:quercetin dioxygenase-like cupin family protein
MEIFHDDIKKLARHNNNFRQVVSTGPHSQLVVMSLLADEDTGDDVHFADQFILVERGTGELSIEGLTSGVIPGDLIHVPGGVRHNVTAGATEPMKLAVMYAPPHFEHRVVHLTKADAVAAEAEAAVIAFREAHREFAKTRSRFFATERV